MQQANENKSRDSSVHFRRSRRRDWGGRRQRSGTDAAREEERSPTCSVLGRPVWERTRKQTDEITE